MFGFSYGVWFDFGLGLVLMVVLVFLALWLCFVLLWVFLQFGRAGHAACLA